MAQADPGLSVGDWLYFDPDPVTISATYKRALRARNFAVLGDFPVIELSLADNTPIRRFERVRSATLGSDEVSIFELVFPASDVRQAYPPEAIRFDRTLFPRMRPSRSSR